MNRDCNYGCTGELKIGPFGILLNTPAWDVPNLVRLWSEATVRGENLVLPNGRGRRGNPQRVDQTEFDLPFVINGITNQYGKYYEDPWVGLESNLNVLWDYAFKPVSTGRGTRHADLTLPSGTVRAAEVQLDPLRFPNDIDNPGYVEAVIHMTVVTGRFV